MEENELENKLASVSTVSQRPCAGPGARKNEDRDDIVERRDLR